MTQFAAIVAVGTLVAGLVAVFALRLLPTVRLQLAGLALLTVALPLAAVTLGGLVMFHMHDDVKLLAVAAASASTALVAALLVGHSIAHRIRSLEGAAAQLAAGDLKARATEDGPREVARLGRSFNEMATNIEGLFDARRQLVAWASHDLRAPLAAIQAMLEAMEDGIATEDEYVPALLEQASALGALIDDLFELAQIDAGALTVELRETPVGELLVSCVRGLEAEARSRSIQLQLSLEEPLPPVHCEPRHIRRVVLNLLTNALRHTPSDGTVFVTARPTGAEVEVLVEDSGGGLSADAQMRMFERFWREDPARVPSSGRAGLGLAIARGLVDAQGGRIWAENRAGGGARVGFSLPLSGSRGRASSSPGPVPA